MPVTVFVAARGRWRWLAARTGNDALVDAVLAALVAVVWFGAMAVLAGHGWMPRERSSYLISGAWTVAAVALRRALPLTLFLVVAVAYPFSYGTNLVSELHLLPLLIAGYSVVDAGRLRFIAAMPIAVASVAAITTGSVAAVRSGWAFQPGFAVGDMRIDRSLVAVNAFAVAAATGLGTLSSRQRATAALLAERNAELERLRDAEVSRATMEERTRIARELHDVVAHHLTAMIVKVQADERVSSGSGANSATLDWVLATAREALASVRYTVGVLRSDDDGAPLVPEPTLADLDRVVAGVNAAGLHTSLRVADDLPPLDRSAQMAVVRITQEALTNSLRHSGGTTAAVVVEADRGGVLLRVDDGGTTKSPSLDLFATVAGNGMHGMRERAVASGGTLVVTGGDLGGWSVRAWLPSTGNS